MDVLERAVAESLSQKVGRGSEVTFSEISQLASSRQFARIKVMGKAGNYLIVFEEDNIGLFDIDKDRFIRTVKWTAL